jgi:serine/threonine protein kinase
MPWVPTLNDFEPIKHLGQGGFGEVFLVKKKSGVDKDRLYAMKAMHIATVMTQDDGPERLQTECYIHKNVVNHRFLAGMHYSFCTETKMCLMLDCLTTFPAETWQTTYTRETLFQKMKHGTS